MQSHRLAASALLCVSGAIGAAACGPPPAPDLGPRDTGANPEIVEPKDDDGESGGAGLPSGDFGGGDNSSMPVPSLGNPPSAGGSGFGGYSGGDDDDAVPASVYPKYECMDPPHLCPAMTKCPEFNGVCSVTECGKSACPVCPDLFKNMIVKGWCAYGRMRGTEDVGGAIIFQTRWGASGPHCFAK